MEEILNTDQPSCMDCGSAESADLPQDSLRVSGHFDDVNVHVCPWGPKKTTDCETDSSSCDISLVKQSMLDRLACSNAHFKHQQRGELDLPYEEKLQIARNLLDSNPTVFLARFGKHLIADDLLLFNSLSDDYIIKFHIGEIRKRLNGKNHQTAVKNRRYEAMKRLMAGGEYFGDDEMKQRDPLLYEEMVGQYLTEKEIDDQVDKSDLSLSNVLLKHLQVTENNKLYEVQKERAVSCL